MDDGTMRYTIAFMVIFCLALGINKGVFSQEAKKKTSQQSTIIKTVAPTECNTNASQHAIS